jgi:hypothetical protein
MLRSQEPGTGACSPDSSRSSTLIGESVCSSGKHHDNVTEAATTMRFKDPPRHPAERKTMGFSKALKRFDGFNYFAGGRRRLSLIGHSGGHIGKSSDTLNQIGCKGINPNSPALRPDERVPPEVPVCFVRVKNARNTNLVHKPGKYISLPVISTPAALRRTFPKPNRFSNTPIFRFAVVLLKPEKNICQHQHNTQPTVSMPKSPMALPVRPVKPAPK